MESEFAHTPQLLFGQNKSLGIALGERTCHEGHSTCFSLQHRQRDKFYFLADHLSRRDHSHNAQLLLFHHQTNMDERTVLIGRKRKI